MNELSLIFWKMGLDTTAVLEAAGTKWNFHPYSPRLVGGHCIPVDPYYLVHKAEVVGYHPQVILAGRAINDHMPKHVAQMMIKGLNEVGKVIKRVNRRAYNTTRRIYLIRGSLLLPGWSRS